MIFISGDVHFGEITRLDCATSYPLYDITSSGLTQAVEDSVPDVLAFFLRVSAWLMPNTMRVYNSECRYKSCVFGEKQCTCLSGLQQLFVKVFILGAQNF